MNSTQQLVYTALFTALIIAGGLISIPLPGLIPVALADFFVMLAGIFEGPRRAAASVALYLALGCIGLPVFAGGKAGLAVLIGPTGGFLVGYLLMAIAIGFLVHAGAPNSGETAKSDNLSQRASSTDSDQFSLTSHIKTSPSTLRLLLALIAGTIVLYTCGIAGMMLLLNLPLQAALLAGLVPLLPGAVIKIVAAVAAGRILLPRYQASLGIAQVGTPRS